MENSYIRTTFGSPALTSYQAGQFNEEEKLKLSATDQFPLRT